MFSPLLRYSFPDGHKHSSSLSCLQAFTQLPALFKFKVFPSISHSLRAQLLSCVWLFVTPKTSPPGSSVHGIFQAKSTGVGCHFLLQWSSWLRDRTPSPSPCFISLHGMFPLLNIKHYRCFFFVFCLFQQNMNITRAEPSCVLYVRSSMPRARLGKK